MHYECIEVFRHLDQPVYAIKLVNDLQSEVTLLTLGATIVDIKTMDQNQNLESIVATYHDINDFKNNFALLGATIGRNCGRIAKAKCNIEGETYTLKKGLFKGSFLHGGPNGLNTKNFEYTITQSDNNIEVILKSEVSYLDDSLPGTTYYEILFSLTNRNQLIVQTKTSATHTTLANITNHTYFNLSGNNKMKIYNHILEVNAPTYLTLDRHLIPDQEKQVVNTPLDFTKPQSLEVIKDKFFDKTGGIDHCLLFEENKTNKIKLQDPLSKRSLTIQTTLPSVVLFTANFGIPQITNNLKPLEVHDAICFECQYEPNGINQTFRNDGLVYQGQTNRETTIYTFNES